MSTYPDETEWTVEWDDHGKAKAWSLDREPRWVTTVTVEDDEGRRSISAAGIPPFVTAIRPKFVADDAVPVVSWVERSNGWSSSVRTPTGHLLAVSPDVLATDRGLPVPPGSVSLADRLRAIADLRAAAGFTDEASVLREAICALDEVES